ncbi:MAG: ABC transporter permease [Clostridia bacterium]|nr:ABC transporter permease [Clostridia bacterium]
MIDNNELLKSQYELMGDSRWPQNYDEVVIAIDTNSEINDFILYSLGLLPQSDITALMKGEEIETGASFTYDQLLGLKYKLLINTEKYKFDNLGYHGEKTNEEIIQQVEEGEEGVIEIKVVGIVRPKKSAAATSINGTIGYTSALTREVIKRIAASDIVKAQLMRKDVNVLTGEEFNITEGETLERNFRRFGYVEEDAPDSISLYAADFASKDKIVNWIENYNATARAEGRNEDVITYTDYVGIMMSSVSTIISAISYVLIGFVAISLIVSSIMIGVITYISVLERTKEIGILRSIGASKRDISRVFNAETFIVGFVAGVIGVLIAMLIDVPINIILAVLANLPSIALVPWWGAIALIAISVGLTLIAGIIPAGLAAKRDPVVALRTE